MIGRLNRYPIFFNGSYTQDAGGGPSFVETERWNAWAYIKDRSGSSFTANSQDQTQYDYRVRVRFDSRFNSDTGMIYEGQVCKCESIRVDSEHYKEFLIINYSRTETYVDIS